MSKRILNESGLKNKYQQPPSYQVATKCHLIAMPLRVKRIFRMQKAAMKSSSSSLSQQCYTVTSLIITSSQPTHSCLVFPVLSGQRLFFPPFLFTVFPNVPYLKTNSLDKVSPPFLFPCSLRTKREAVWLFIG